MRALPFAALMLAASAAQAADLAIEVVGAGPVGVVRLMVFRDAASFVARTDAVTALVVYPRAGRASAALPGLPAGSYAVAAFQDLNGSDWFGRPREPYGFSNDAREAFGPPDFARAAVSAPDRVPSWCVSIWSSERAATGCAVAQQPQTKLGRRPQAPPTTPFAGRGFRRWPLRCSPRGASRWRPRLALRC